MKTTIHLITIFVLATTRFTLLSQTLPAPNGDFENWTGFAPDQWYAPQAPGNILVINQVPGNGGGSAIRGDVIFDIELENFITPLVQTGPEEAGTFPVDAQYAWCLFDYQFHNAGDDGFYITIAMMNDDDMEVGYGSVYISSEATTFTTHNLPISYVGAATKARITFIITDTDEVAEFDGSYFILDNVRLSDTPTGVTHLPTDQVLNITLNPNPAADATMLTVNLPDPSTVSYVIMDHCGKEVFRMSTPQLPAGENRIGIDVQELAAGVYFIQVNTKSGQVVARLEVGM